MSLPHFPEITPALTEKAIAAQAAKLEQLRGRVASAQAAGEKLDPVLVAEFATAQRAFIVAKIQLEQLRKAGLLVEAPEEIVVEAAELAPVAAIVEPEIEAVPMPVIEVAASPASEPSVVIQTSPAVQKSGRLLTASRVFWLLLILALTFLLWFLRSPLADVR
jgi:hypothetical protein